MATAKTYISSFLSDRKKCSESLAIVALVIYVATQILFRNSTLEITHPIISELHLEETCTNIAVAVAIVAIAIKPKSLRLWQSLLVVAAIAILVYSATFTGDYRLVQGYVLLIAIAGIDLDELCEAYYLTVIPVLITVLLLAIVGIEYNKDVIPNSRLVFAYGFGHPNTTGCLLFSAIGAMTFSCWNKPSWTIPLALSLAAAAFSYISLSSHASAGLLIALAAINTVGHISKLAAIQRIPKSAYITILCIVPLCLLGMMLYSAALFDDNQPVFAWLNELIHGRPRYSHEYFIDNGGFTVFGRKYTVAQHYHTGLPFSGVDSGYCKLALTYGILSMCILAASYLVAVWKTSDNPKRLLILAIFLIEAAYMCVESTPLFIAVSFATLFLSSAFTTEKAVVLTNEASSVAKHAKKCELVT